MAGSLIARAAPGAGLACAASMLAAVSEAREAEDAVHAEREASFLLAVPEKRFLRWLAGEAAALDPARRHDRARGRSRRSPSPSPTSSPTTRIWWLWVASALLVVQWIGDSLDGTLARVRGIERPTYGYYLDHLVDAIATAAIGIGLGL